MEPGRKSRQSIKVHIDNLSKHGRSIKVWTIYQSIIGNLLKAIKIQTTYQSVDKFSSIRSSMLKVISVIESFCFSKTNNYSS